MTAPYIRPIVTVDVVVLTLRAGQLQVLEVQRQDAAEPFCGAWGLPGGYVHVEEDDDTASAARRVLRGKTGGHVGHLEQLYTFSGAGRDPRGWSVSVVYLALVQGDDGMGLRPDQAGVRWVNVDEAGELPFDHAAILAKALDRVRGKAAYSSLPAFLIAPVFTWSELMGVYEVVLGQTLDASTFRRKVEAQMMIVPAHGQRRHTGAGRPAGLYRLSTDALHDFGRVVLSERA